MRVLVTGATGFVGANLVRRLIDSGWESHVTVRSESNQWRIAGLERQLTVHEADLRDSERVRRIVSLARPQVIYHLAACGGFTSQTESRDVLLSNLLGTVNLVRACEKLGFDCFVNTGSSSEYGIKQASMQEDDRVNPLGDYAVSKAAATLFCSSEALTKGLPIITLRLFSPYGPWDYPGRLIPYLIKSYLRQEVPNLSAPGFVRDFVYIGDVVEAYLQAVKAPGIAGEVLNIGSGIQSSVGEVTSLLAEKLQATTPPRWGKYPPRPLEPKVWLADLGKVKAKLDWEPKTPLSEGLDKTILWFRDSLSLYPRG